MKYIQGDLLEAFDKGEIDILGQQSNCLGLTYFKGIAKSIHDKFKGLTEVHVEYCKGLPFGTVLVYPVNDQYVVNIYGQYYIGAPSNLPSRQKNKKDILDGVHADNFLVRTQALELALRELNNITWGVKPLKLGLPLISSGLASDPLLKAGMNDLDYFKKYIAHIVEDNLTNFDITIYYL